MLLSNPLREGALDIVRTLRAHGHEALWAGGCVRDMVLGRPPKDYDVATSATPEEVIACFARAIPVGVQFGVVRVIHQNHEYEVATFRTDGEYVDGRRPTGVRWATAEDDVARRDFTINGLLYDPIADTIIDYVGGREDLEHGIIRAIGHAAARFAEDHLRVLRAIRFAARFGFVIEDETWREVNVFAGRVTSVSVERIRDEIGRLLTDGGASKGLALLVDSGVGAAILPGLDLTIPARHFRVLGTCDEAVGWGLLFAHETSAEALQRMESLRHSRQFSREVAEIVDSVHALRTYPDLGVAARKRLLRRSGAAFALTVAAAAGIPVAEARDDRHRWPPEVMAPPALINGRDLSAAGFKAGPSFKAALEAVETAQLEGAVGTRDEAMALALAILSGAKDT